MFSPDLFGWLLLRRRRGEWRLAWLGLADHCVVKNQHARKTIAASNALWLSCPESHPLLECLFLLLSSGLNVQNGRLTESFPTFFSLKIIRLRIFFCFSYFLVVLFVSLDPTLLKQTAMEKQILEDPSVIAGREDNVIFSKPTQAIKCLAISTTCLLFFFNSFSLVRFTILL